MIMNGLHWRDKLLVTFWARQSNWWTNHLKRLVRCSRSFLNSGWVSILVYPVVYCEISLNRHFPWHMENVVLILLLCWENTLLSSTQFGFHTLIIPSMWISTLKLKLSVCNGCTVVPFALFWRHPIPRWSVIFKLQYHQPTSNLLRKYTSILRVVHKLPNLLQNNNASRLHFLPTGYISLGCFN